MREVSIGPVQRGSIAANYTMLEELVCLTNLQGVLLTIIDYYRTELTCSQYKIWIKLQDLHLGAYMA